jgi:hypothetical protein
MAMAIMRRASESRKWATKRGFVAHFLDYQISKNRRKKVRIELVPEIFTAS